MESTYPIPKNLNECFTVLDQIFHESEEEDKEWFISSDENEAVSGMHNGLGRWMRNRWGLWTKDTELYNTLKNMELWHADDMSSVIMISYHRKLNGKELDLKTQIEYYINHWEEYEKTNGPIEKK